MDYMHITGGIPLRGSITVNGAKNVALPLMAMGLLTGEPVSLEGVPLVDDIKMMHLLLEDLGVSIRQFHKCFVLQADHIQSVRASYEFVRKMRASIVVLGALVGRCGQAEVSLPGGCAIGVRPVNFHLEGLKALGVDIDLQQGYIVARAPFNRVIGGKYTFPKPSVTGTQNLLFAAVLARGESCLENVALEPEITDLITCLQKMGAVIEGKGTSTLYIQGKPSLSGVQHTVLPDRIEMGTYMVAAAITQGDIILEGADLALLPSVVELLKEIGVFIEELGDHRVRISAHDRLSSFHIHTAPFPGFPTDLQAQFMALATLARGESCIVENIWENRFMHVAELTRMGASIELQGNQALIQGCSELMGAQVMATDLRASVGLVLAALAARGETVVRRIYHLDRGYERLEDKLAVCGAQIRRLTSDVAQDELSSEELLVVGS